MADTLSNNLQLLEMATGSASGTWGSLLNSAVITILDQALGNTQSVSLSSTDVTLTMTQRQNLAFAFTGTLSGSLAVKLPFNANSTTVAVGGIFVVDNQTTGAFAVTVKTVASGSTGVEVPQGVRSVLYSDTVNVWYADDAQNQILTYNGNPNGSVAGNAGSASTRASHIIDRATNTEYLCTTSGTASAAVWSVNLPFSFPLQGYLTASSDTTSPILTADSIGATTIYLSGYAGNLGFIYNGVSFVPVPITGGQLTLALSNSSQGSNGIYDVMFFLDSSTPRIGFSPAWTTATAGAGNRGTGGGTSQLTRVNGLLVNAVQQTVNNGSSSYVVAANRGTYVGTVSIDATAGQVTCHRSYGQARKFGIWNNYNRIPIILKGGDSTGSWSNTSVSFRAVNSDSNNKATVLCGMAEEIVDASYEELVGSEGSGARVGIGWNSTSSSSGFSGGENGVSTSRFAPIAHYTQTTPFIGINNVQMLEASLLGNNTGPQGGEAACLLTVRYRG